MFLGIDPIIYSLSVNYIILFGSEKLKAYVVLNSSYHGLPTQIPPTLKIIIEETVN